MELKFNCISTLRKSSIKDLQRVPASTSDRRTTTRLVGYKKLQNRHRDVCKTGYFIVFISDDVRRRAIDILSIAFGRNRFSFVVVAQIASLTTPTDRHSRRVL